MTTAHKTDKRFYSLRRRLLLSIIGICVFFWLISLAIMVYVAWDETNDVFDDALKKSASLLLQSTNNTFEPFKQKTSSEKLDRDDLHYQIIQKGVVVSRTKDSPIEPFIKAFPKHKGFTNLLINNDEWRIYVLRAQDGSFEVQVGQSLKMRAEILEELAEDLMIPALLLLFVLSITSAFAIYYLLKPLTIMADALTKKSPEDLSPLSLETHSLELSAITYALNGVLARLSSALNNERRFTADAAHELRTPLAAMGMQAQLLQRQYPDLHIPLQKLREDIHRATHLITHLLLLARLDPLKTANDKELNYESINLPELFEALNNEFDKQAEAKNITLIYSADTKNLYANCEMIHILLRNLIDNALRYSIKNSNNRESNIVEFRALERDGHIILTVNDNGKGVAPEVIDQLTERFFRILGTEESGSGLGLSIVKRIAELHHASLEISTGDDGQGLKVSITFPQSP